MNKIRIEKRPIDFNFWKHHNAPISYMEAPKYGDKAWVLEVIIIDEIGSDVIELGNVFGLWNFDGNKKIKQRLLGIENHIPYQYYWNEKYWIPAELQYISGILWGNKGMHRTVHRDFIMKYYKVFEYLVRVKNDPKIKMIYDYALEHPFKFYAPEEKDAMSILRTIKETYPGSRFKLRVADNIPIGADIRVEFMKTDPEWNFHLMLKYNHSLYFNARDIRSQYGSEVKLMSRRICAKNEETVTMLQLAYADQIEKIIYRMQDPKYKQENLE